MQRNESGAKAATGGECGWVPNEQQQQAIGSIHGPVMVISCAGSGKTSVILERTNAIIKSGVLPRKILVVTFSKAATLEMKKRFIRKYGNQDVKFSTIHSICYFILRDSYGLQGSAVLDAGDKNVFLRDEYIRLRREYAGHEENGAASYIKKYKDWGDFCKDISHRISEFMTRMYEKKLDSCKDLKRETDLAPDPDELDVFSSYLRFKEAGGKIDYDDIIIECHKCLSTRPDVLGRWQETYHYIMIDEFQDTTVLQAEIFFMLAGTRNICVVGDDDQSIYSFRHVDGAIFHKFLKQYKDAKQVFMETNYRSEPEIITHAERLITHNVKRFRKHFKPFRTGHAKINISGAEDSIVQTDLVVNLIREYENRGIPLSDIAILYRIKNEAMITCSRLLAERIPFYTKEPPEDIHDGLVFKDIKAYYRLANDIWGKSDLRRIINRPSRHIKASLVANCEPARRMVIVAATGGIYDVEYKELVAGAVNRLFDDLEKLRGKTPGEFMKYLHEDMGYREYLSRYADFIRAEPRTFLDSFDELAKEAERFNTMPEWSRFARECRDEMYKRMEENKKKGVYLSTFHSSKGLEWENVIILSANDDVTPLVRDNTIQNPEEERRLFYVAMTRAREGLNILYTKGDSSKRIPSRYIREMMGDKPLPED